MILFSSCSSSCACASLTATAKLAYVGHVILAHGEPYILHLCPPCSAFQNEDKRMAFSTKDRSSGAATRRMLRSGFNLVVFEERA